MDPECAQLLPHVCAVLIDKRGIMTDNAILQKLLDWFRSLVSTVPVGELLEENLCIEGMLDQLMNFSFNPPNLYVFAFRLGGMLAGYEAGFRRLMAREFLDNFSAFIGMTILYEIPSVRLAWIQGLQDMLKHKDAFTFFQDSCMEVLFAFQDDKVETNAYAADELMAHIILASVQIEGWPDPEGSANLPDVALDLLNHMQQKLSDTPNNAGHCLRTLTFVFRGGTDLLVHIVWRSFFECVMILLMRKPVSDSPYIKELLSTALRFPILQSSRSMSIASLYALQTLDVAESVSFASEILKIHGCPVNLHEEARLEFLRPFCYIIKITSDCRKYPEWADVIRIVKPAFETAMASKRSSVDLICRSLGCLTDLIETRSLKKEIPECLLLDSLATLLSLCIGQAVCVLPRLELSKNMIGCQRVQRMAMDTLRCLSSWTMSTAVVQQIFRVLLLYVVDIDSDSTILKKTFQAALKWLLECSLLGNSVYWPDAVHFLNDVYKGLQKRFCSPSWEIRDTAIEFITDLVQTLKNKEVFKQAADFAVIPQQILVLVKDPESYVRASAVNCLGQLDTIYDVFLPTASGEDLTTKTLVSIFLNILSEDTDYFPRRMVMKVFVDWTRQEHIQVSYSMDDLLPKLLKVTKEDSDWEVKVHALELAGVFVDQTFDTFVADSCPYAVGLPIKGNVGGKAGALKKFNTVGLFPFLLDALSADDRMVALKACQILLSLRSKLSDGEETHSCSDGSELQGLDWLEETMRNWRREVKDGLRKALDKNWSDLLNKIDLANLETSLSKGSCSSHQKPQSLLLDIRTALWGGEEQDADCY
uniref:BRCA1-associated ATM activator 1 n=1 Tax=Leptobrachium leishanense TaxID=445787 RepID=A0A8C5N5G8_9ANUR